MQLKGKLTSAAILTGSRSHWQFIVEVDASNEGIGAVLSQRCTQYNCLHPCGFLSKKLSPAEKNYCVGNRELLPVHVTLEEWRHWLKGA